MQGDRFSLKSRRFHVLQQGVYTATHGTLCLSAKELDPTLFIKIRPQQGALCARS